MAGGGCVAEGAAEIGQPCQEKEDCLTGMCLQERRYNIATGWDRGYCTDICSGGCGQGAVCVQLSDASYCLSQCSVDTDCRPGYLCNPTFGACLPDCRREWDCGDGYECGANGYCIQTGTDMPRGDAAIGEACDSMEECVSGLCFRDEYFGAETGWTGGYCTEACAGECGEDAQCVQFADSAYCLARCMSLDGCREGYLCNPDVEACLPDCRHGWDCGDGFECNQEGYCVQAGSDIPRGDAAVGEACTRLEDCASGICFRDEYFGVATGWTGGYCTDTCDGSCQGDDQCVQLVDSAYCLSHCASSDDCRKAYICSPDVEACLPDCRNGWDCGANLACGEDGLCTVETTADTDQGQDTDDGTGEDDGEGDTGALMGEACDRNTDCKSGYCVKERETSTGSAWIDGMCSKACGTCPDGFSCTDVKGVALCLPDCRGDAACREGYVCSTHSYTCLPDCRLGFICELGSECNFRGVCIATGGGGGPGSGPGGIWFNVAH